MHAWHIQYGEVCGVFAFTDRPLTKIPNAMACCLAWVALLSAVRGEKHGRGLWLFAVALSQRLVVEVPAPVRADGPTASVV